MSQCRWGWNVFHKTISVGMRSRGQMVLDKQVSELCLLNSGFNWYLESKLKIYINCGGGIPLMNRVQLTVACSVFCHLGNGVNSVTVSTLTVARKGEQEHDEIHHNGSLQPLWIKSKTILPFGFLGVSGPSTCIRMAAVQEWDLPVRATRSPYSQASGSWMAFKGQLVW